jgi:hypothetical protein
MWHWAGAKVSHLEEEIDYAAPAASCRSRPSLAASYQSSRKDSTAFIDIEPITPHGFLCGFLGASGAGSGIGSELATSASRWPACGALESSSGAGDADNSDGRNFT